MSLLDRFCFGKSRFVWNIWCYLKNHKYIVAQTGFVSPWSNSICNLFAGNMGTLRSVRQTAAAAVLSATDEDDKEAKWLLNEMSYEEEFDWNAPPPKFELPPPPLPLDACDFAAEKQPTFNLQHHLDTCDINFVSMLVSLHKSWQ